MAAEPSGTFGITGMPRPENVEVRTDQANNIPYVTNMPRRYEITDFFQKMSDPKTEAATRGEMQKQWTLFIFALDRFKALTVEERLSYFQVAGIHGYPEQSWDGADPPTPDPKEPQPGQDPYGGYCHHNTIAFPTWHRPYLLLFEQCIWRNMEFVIEDWKANGDLPKDDVSWTSAAKTWRLFYWDWARKQSYPTHDWIDKYGLPYLCVIDPVPTFPPNTQGQQYGFSPNPLVSFANPEKYPNGEPRPFGEMPKGKEKWNLHDNKPYPWGKCSAISRWGILQTGDDPPMFEGLEGVNNWVTCNLVLSEGGKRFYEPKQGNKPNQDGDDDDWGQPSSIADAVNRMFSIDYTTAWGYFASTKWYDEEVTDSFMSLEYVHNNIHNITGGLALKRSSDGKDDLFGAGQMSDVPVAAFDPIFWLHHCNVDRYTAMWQCLNWDRWFEKEPPEVPRDYSRIPDVTPNDPLEPFHRYDNGRPDDANNKWTSTLARDWTCYNYQYDDLEPSDEAVDTDGRLIASEYKKQLHEHIQKLYPNTSDLAHQIYERKDRAFHDNFFGPITAQKKAFGDYIINVKYDRYALDGGRSYSIEFYLEDVYAGQVYSFGGAPRGSEVGIGCANCGDQARAKVLSRGQVPISVPLMLRALRGDGVSIDVSTSSAEEGEGLTAFTDERVGPYLRRHLKVRFFEAGGAEREASDFPDTEWKVIAGAGMRGRERRVVGGGGDGVTVLCGTPYYVRKTYKVLIHGSGAPGNDSRAGLKWGAVAEPGKGLEDLVRDELPDEAPLP